MIILHCAEKSKWEQESKNGTYGSEFINSTGFIPCMRAEDIRTDNFTHSSIKDLIILCIDTDKVTSEIKYEKDILNDTQVPNIYGLLNTDAVSDVKINYTYDSDDKFIISNEIRDITIINEVLKVLNINYISHKYFNDGTTSRIILLNDKYVIKQSNPAYLKSEVIFSDINRMPKLQEVIYHEENYRYIIYNYIQGDIMHTVDNFEDLITNIKEITNSYKEYNGPEFGYLSEPSSSWYTFLREMVQLRSLTLTDSSSFLPQVYDAISELEKYPFEKKLIHGDFGTHNFIKSDGKFVVAIDPVPIVGDPLYDILYALVSNVDILPRITLSYLERTFDDPIEKIKAMLTVVLFCRLSICLKYHKEDLDDFVNFWYRIIK